MHQEPLTPEAPPTGGAPEPGGARRAITMALLAAGLLLVGVTAVTYAADPSASPTTPSATASPDDGGTTAPDQGVPDGRHGRGGQGGNPGDCPADQDGSGGGSGASGSDDSSTPATPTLPDETTSPDPTTTPDPAEA